MMIFFNETCKRSVGILEAVDSEATLEIYLKRVATTAIINVLKDSGRLRRSRTSYMSTKKKYLMIIPKMMLIIQM